MVSEGEKSVFLLTVVDFGVDHSREKHIGSRFCYQAVVRCRHEIKKNVAREKSIVLMRRQKYLEVLTFLIISSDFDHNQSIAFQGSSSTTHRTTSIKPF